MSAHGMGRIYLLMTLLAMVVFLSFALSGYALVQSAKQERQVRTATCVLTNNTRKGGPDYSRPVLRALVKLAGKQAVIAFIEKEGFKASLADLNDIAQIDCETGKPFS